MHIHMDPLLLAWFNFNPSMDKYLHPLQCVGLNYLSLTHSLHVIHMNIYIHMFSTLKSTCDKYQTLVSDEYNTSLVPNSNNGWSRLICETCISFYDDMHYKDVALITLVHSPLVHIYASVNWFNIGSGSPVRRHAVTQTNAGLLSVWLLGTTSVNFKQKIMFHSFHSWKCTCKCRLRNGCYFVQGEMG